MDNAEYKALKSDLDQANLEYLLSASLQKMRRERIAVAALTGLMPTGATEVNGRLAEVAVGYADALIEAVDRPANTLGTPGPIGSLCTDVPPPRPGSYRPNADFTIHYTYLIELFLIIHQEWWSDETNDLHQLRGVSRSLLLRFMEGRLPKSLDSRLAYVLMKFEEWLTCFTHCDEGAPDRLPARPRVGQDNF